MARESGSGTLGVRARILIKVAVAFGIGSLTFAVTSAFEAEASRAAILGLSTSLFVGGLVLVTEFLVGVDLQTARLSESVRGLDRRAVQLVEAVMRSVRVETRKVSTAAELLGQLDESSLDGGVVTQLVRNASTVRGASRLVADFAAAEITRLSGYLQELGQGGDVAYDGEDRDWLLTLTRVATTSIDATSLSTTDAGGRGFANGGLWDSTFGRHYLMAQREAIERNVRIRRIFVIDRPDLEGDPGLSATLQKHAAIGVEVRTLRLVDVKEDQKAALRDVVLIDNALSYEVRTAPRTDARGVPIVVSTTIVSNLARVGRRAGDYEDLWQAAKPLG